MCKKSIGVCISVRREHLSLKELKINRGDGGLMGNGIRGAIPPPLVFSPWVRAEGAGNTKHGEGLRRHAAQCLRAKGAPLR